MQRYNHFSNKQNFFNFFASIGCILVAKTPITMDKRETLNDIYRQLAGAGVVTTKKEFAQLLGVNDKGLSSAMNGSERHLTDSLVAKAVRLLNERLAEDTPEEYTVPLVPFSVRGGALQGFSDGAMEWECERITSPVAGAELAMEVVGDSMAPGFPAGTRVLLKAVPADTFVAWGEVYVLDTVNGPVLKRIMPTDEGDVWELRSDNPDYPPFRIRTQHVRGVWRVLLRMIQ